MTMSSNVFHVDLEAGHNTEKEVLEYVRKKYPMAYRKKGYFKGYDLYVPEIQKSIEVKQDYKSEYTGNIVVEVEFNGKPSALSTTTADYWVFVSHRYLIWITPKQICDAIRKYKTKPVNFVGRGDTLSKKAYLVPTEHLIEFSLNTLTREFNKIE